MFSYARTGEKLQKLARDAHAKSGTPREAAQDADVLLLAVHWSRVDDVLRHDGDLKNAVVVTCSLPMNATDTGLVVAHTSSGAEEIATPRPSLVYCGDDARGKQVAATLIRDAGFDPLAAGPLQLARYTEPFALLIGALAYSGSRGSELAYRFEWFRS